jgi:hypothetical protein
MTRDSIPAGSLRTGERSDREGLPAFRGRERGRTHVIDEHPSLVVDRDRDFREDLILSFGGNMTLRVYHRRFGFPVYTAPMTAFPCSTAGDLK